MKFKASPFITAVFTMTFLAALVMSSGSGYTHNSRVKAEPIFERVERRPLIQSATSYSPAISHTRAPALQHIFTPNP